MSNKSVDISLSKSTGPATAVQSMLAAEPVQAYFYKENLQDLPIQRKLSIGAVSDPLEQEADAMADTVMRMPETSLVQRKCSHCEEEEQVQKKPLASSVTPFIQTKGADGGTASDSVTQQINATRGNGSSMDRPTQSFMESRFGTDFSNVKIHTGTDAVQMNRELNAQAFTVGNDIYFNSGKYNPSSDSGKSLLAHELTHTVQQGATAGIQRVPDRTVLPEIGDPAAVETWQSPGGEKYQWENEALISRSFPERAKGLLAFLMLVKELELRGHLGEAPVAKKEVNNLLRVYLDEISKLDEKELAGKVTAVFEQYTDTAAFPAWMQNVVMNYSGMKYESAHGSYYDPVNLLAIIKRNELDTAGTDEINYMVGEAAEMMQSTAGPPLLKPKDRKALVSELEKNSLNTLTKKIPAKEKEAFAALMIKDGELWQLYIDLHQTAIGSQAFVDVQSDILKKEAETAAMETLFGKATWKKIKKMQAAKKQALLNLSRAVAMQKVRILSDGQALQLLSVMYDAGNIPEEAWKEIVGHTELRLQVSSLDEMVTSRRALKDTTPDPAISGAAWRQWKYFLQQWYKQGDATGWRADHRETLSANIVTTLVCDQLGSVIQNIRGVTHDGGLRKNAEAYYNAAKAAGGTGPAKTAVTEAYPQAPTEPFFKKPASLSDFPVGASIFWTKWSDVSVTAEYLKVYKEEEALKATIRRNEKNKTETSTKRKKTPRDEGNLKKYDSAIAAAQLRLDELKKQQETMRIFTPGKDKTPDNSNIVRPMEGSGLGLVSKGKKITECMTDDGWTYSVNDKRTVGKNKMSSIMRAKPNSFLRTAPLKCPDELMEGQDDTIVKQWLTWQHEATVMFVIPETDTVVTFDTSFKLGVGDDAKEVKALGTRKRRLSDLLGDENLFVGYMPEK